MLDEKLSGESHCEELIKKLNRANGMLAKARLCLNRLSLNISKTNFVIFHAINKPNHNVTILINKQAIHKVKYVKYLGILIDSHLTFKDHINELNKKISRAIGILYRLRQYVTTKILCNVYCAIIYPLLFGVMLVDHSLNLFILCKKNLFAWLHLMI